MRLAIVCTHPIQYYAPVFSLLAQTPGLEVRVFYGWQGLVAGGHDRDFGQAIQWDIPLLEGYESEFVPNLAPDPGPHNFRGIDCPTLIAQIKSWQADALLVYGWSFKSHLQAIRHFHGKIPVCFRGDSTLLDERPGLKRLLRRTILRWVYSKVDLAFYVGTQNRLYYEAMGLKPAQLHFAPHAVDNQRFADPTGSHAQAAADWRHRLGIAADAIVFLQVGKLDENKAPHELLAAFQQLPSAQGSHLIFAGSGTLESSLKQRAGSNVHFLGFQNQAIMPTVYRLGNVLVMPSHRETWGLAINEAMASGCAIAASEKVGSAIDLIGPEQGWTFPVGSTAALQAVLQTALTCGTSALQRMGAASVQRIQDWSVPQQAKCIAQTLLAL